MYWIKFLSEVEGSDNRPEQRMCLNDFSGVKLSWTTRNLHIRPTSNQYTAYLRVFNKESLKKYEIYT